MNDFAAIKAYCAQKTGSQATLPFGPDTLVYKVMGKMFALMPPENPADKPPTINLKCDPNLALHLRQEYEAVQPGYHMNKRHWNTITLDGTFTEERIFEMIDDSYALVVAKLTKADKKRLQELEN